MSYTESISTGEKHSSSLALTNWRVHIWAIMVLAFTLRLMYLAQIHHWPFFFHLVLDSRTQNSWAEILLRTLGLGNSEVLAKPPLYAYYLAFVKLLVGTGELSLLVARLLQLVMGTATCGLTYLIGRRVFGAPVGFLGSLFLALYGPGIFNEGELLDTALATLLATAFLLALLATLDQPTGPRWFGVGLLLGLLGLTRGNLLLLAPLTLLLAFIWLARSSAREAMGRMALLFIAGLLVTIAPITARNAIIIGRLVPISTNGGINFYTGNNPDADGYTPILSGLQWERTWYTPAPGPRPVTGLPRTLGSLPLAEQDRYWARKGLAFWVTQPARAFALLIKKAYLYWGGYEIPNNLSYAWGRSHASLLRVVLLTFGILGPLALLGIALGGWGSRSAWLLTLFILVQMLAVIAFFVNGRYRMTALPVMCVFAALALIEIFRRAQLRRWGAVLSLIVALLSLATFVNADLYGVGRARGANRDWVFLGQSYVRQMKFPQARAAFRRATEANPQDADAWYYLAEMSRREGDISSAASAFRRALRVAPDFGACAASFADLALASGWPLQEPRRLLEEAIESQPVNLEALAALVRIDVKLHQKEAAAKSLARAVEAFALWNQSDSGYSTAARTIQRAAEEAQLIGVPLPSILQARERPPQFDFQ